jgi:hypothetical protein
MLTILWVLIGLTVLGAVLFTRAYARLHGTRLVTCPSTQATVAVEIDAAKAAFTASFGRPQLELSDCSLWPERAGCGTPCLAQIEKAPADCLVRSVLTRFYEGQSCALCGRRFGAIRWHDRKPALLAPEGQTFEWSEIVPASIPEVLGTHRPVCWNCHISEGFRRKFPDLYIDAPPKEGPKAPLAPATRPERGRHA